MNQALNLSDSLDDICRENLCCITQILTCEVKPTIHPKGLEWDCQINVVCLNIHSAFCFGNYPLNSTSNLFPVINEELNTPVAAVPCSEGEHQVQQEPEVHPWNSTPGSAKGMPAGQGMWCFPSSEDISAVLCWILGSPEQETRGHPRERPVTGHKSY